MGGVAASHLWGAVTTVIGGLSPPGLLRLNGTHPGWQGDPTRGPRAQGPAKIKHFLSTIVVSVRALVLRGGPI